MGTFRTQYDLTMISNTLLEDTMLTARMIVNTLNKLEKRILLVKETELRSDIVPAFLRAQWATRLFPLHGFRFTDTCNNLSLDITISSYHLE